MYILLTIDYFFTIIIIGWLWSRSTTPRQAQLSIGLVGLLYAVQLFVIALVQSSNVSHLSALAEFLPYIAMLFPIVMLIICSVLLIRRATGLILSINLSEVCFFTSVLSLPLLLLSMKDSTGASYYSQLFKNITHFSSVSPLLILFSVLACIVLPVLFFWSAIQPLPGVLNAPAIIPRRWLSKGVLWLSFIIVGGLLAWSLLAGSYAILALVKLLVPIIFYFILFIIAQLSLRAIPISQNAEVVGNLQIYTPVITPLVLGIACIPVFAEVLVSDSLLITNLAIPAYFSVLFWFVMAIFVAVCVYIGHSMGTRNKGLVYYAVISLAFAYTMTTTVSNATFQSKESAVQAQVTSHTYELQPYFKYTTGATYNLAWQYNLYYGHIPRSMDQIKQAFPEVTQVPGYSDYVNRFGTDPVSITADPSQNNGALGVCDTIPQQFVDPTSSWGCMALEGDYATKPEDRDTTREAVVSSTLYDLGYKLNHDPSFILPSTLPMPTIQIQDNNQTSYFTDWYLVQSPEGTTADGYKLSADGNDFNWCVRMETKERLCVSKKDMPNFN